MSIKMPIHSQTPQKPEPTKAPSKSSISPLELSTQSAPETPVDASTRRSAKSLLTRFASAVKATLFGTNKSAQINPFSHMHDDFKAVVAGTKGPNDISDFKPIITDMKQHFENNNLGELYTKLTTKQGVSEEELACAWMMKLGNNESLTDEKFLNYVSKGQDIFNDPETATLNFTTTDGSSAQNDLPAMSWYLLAKSGTGLMEKGSTRITLPNQKAYKLLEKMQQNMVRRTSTHFGGTSLVGDQGFGKDIPHEKLRADMPFKLGHMLMYPTSKDSAEDTFAQKILTQSSQVKLSKQEISNAYKESFGEDKSIPTKILTAIIEKQTNNESFSSKLDIFECCHKADPSSFNIDVGIKFEDYGFKDKVSHTLAHAKIGKPIMNFINNHWYKVGSKKTKLKKAFAKEVQQKEQLTKKELKKKQKKSISTKKEHMSTLGKQVNKSALKLAQQIPGYTQGWKTRIEFNPKSFMHEKTVAKQGSGTTAIKYLLNDAIKFTKTKEFDKLDQETKTEILTDITTIKETLDQTGTIEGSENIVDLS